MNSMPEIEVAALRKNISTGFHRLRFGRISVPIRYRRGTNDTMILIFHGAVDQKKREIPRYQTFLPDLEECHQLSIFDTSLELNSNLRSGWYIGGSSMPLQADLPEMLRVIFEISGAKRRIYVGGSSGGFAALYYSLVDVGSACVAVNPQTELASYRPRAMGEYLHYAWPGINSVKEIDAVTDLVSAYAKGFQNLVIYLQSVGDLYHYEIQMPRFCNVGLKNPEYFILNSGYWGVPGHSASIPAKDYYSWVKAVVAAPWLDRQAILDTHHLLTAKSVSSLPPSGAPETYPTAHEDLRLSTLLREYHLRQSTDT